MALADLKIRPVEAFWGWGEGGQCRDILRGGPVKKTPCLIQVTCAVLFLIYAMHVCMYIFSIFLDISTCIQVEKSSALDCGE